MFRTEQQNGETGLCSLRWVEPHQLHFLALMSQLLEASSSDVRHPSRLSPKMLAGLVMNFSLESLFLLRSFQYEVSLLMKHTLVHVEHSGCFSKKDFAFWLLNPVAVLI